MTEIVTIAEWPSGRRGEVVRMTIGEFGGRRLINLRKWFEAENGSMRPGRSGMALGIKHLHRLADGLAEARKVAIAQGMIEPER